MTGDRCSYACREGNVGRFQHEEGGIVEEILARNGVNVVTGDVLLRLDDMIPRANLGVVAGAGINPADWTNDIRTEPPAG